MMSSAHNTSIAQNSSLQHPGVIFLYQRSLGKGLQSYVEVSLTGGVSCCTPQDIFSSMTSGELHLLSKYFPWYKHTLLQSKNLVKLLHWAGASFPHKHVNLTHFPEWRCHSVSSATLFFQRCQDCTRCQQKIRSPLRCCLYKQSLP